MLVPHRPPRHTLGMSQTDARLHTLAFDDLHINGGKVGESLLCLKSPPLGQCSWSCDRLMLAVERLGLPTPHPHVQPGVVVSGNDLVLSLSLQKCGSTHGSSTSSLHVPGASPGASLGMFDLSYPRPGSTSRLMRHLGYRVNAKIWGCHDLYDCTTAF
ncbi:hypothetical protein TcWFU_009480 [Taenia crassiceps]|uniref:Uncharacterized protein n=1 Tax=Taenia crassiceps TaxID=6207 RepID=A0ABR4QI28_9CEST